VIYWLEDLRLKLHFIVVEWWLLMTTPRNLITEHRSNRRGTSTNCDDTEKLDSFHVTVRRKNGGLYSLMTSSGCVPLHI